MLTWLKHLSYGYAVCLPGLALGAIIILDLPIIQLLHLPNRDVLGFISILLLFPIACYLSFVTEVVPFPKQLPTALWATMFIPGELMLSLWISHVSLWYLFIIQATVELLGILLLITVLVVQKLLQGDRQWFLAGVLGLAVLTGAVTSSAVLYAILPNQLITYLGILGAIVGVGYRYFQYLRKGGLNQIAPATTYLVVGLIATVSIPLLAFGFTQLL